jgi:multidrug transporter EmrE-like cation transporter
MQQPLLALVAVICNVAAQLCAKHAGQGMQLEKGFSTWISPWLMVAVALYGVSFILMVRVYAVNPLSIASPAMAGGTFLLVTLTSAFLLGESMSMQKLAGILLIFIGIVLLSRS